MFLVIPQSAGMKRHRQSFECVLDRHFLSGPVHLAQEREIPIHVFDDLIDLFLADVLVDNKEIGLRYGLNGQEPQTLETVGKQFSITRERIRQIEASAIRRLKHPSMNKYLKHYVRE